MAHSSSRISAAEAAIEAWVSCKPQGYMLDESRVPELLPLIALKVPNTSPVRYNSMLEELFTRKGGEEPVFSSLLRAQYGKVHFLNFWKAFGKAVHMCVVTTDEGLLAELETLRDRVLHIVEDRLRGDVTVSSDCDNLAKRASIPGSTLIDEVHRAASMSGNPHFWQDAAVSLSQHSEVPQLHLDQLCSLLLLWLNDCASWKELASMRPPPPDSRTQPQCFNPFADTWGSWDIATQVSAIFASTSSSHSGLPVAPRVGHMVYVHVYDVSQTEGIQRLNKVLAHADSPVKLGGVFHAGVEVNGLEWSFAYQPHETRSGVACNTPKTHAQHHFRQTVKMGITECPAEEITAILARMVEEYPGDDYDLLRRNCCHFADDMCQRLGVGSIPGWVHRLARIGAGVATMLQAAQSVRNQVVYTLQAAECAPTVDTLHILRESEFIEEP